MNAIAPLSQAELASYSELIFSLAGISLTDKKLHLVESRLRPRLERTGQRSYAAYLAYLKSLPSGHEEWQTFINLMTTNKTDFFREPSHFEYLLEEVLPVWLRRDEESFRVWSCASSTGEEPYTLAMILKHHLPPDRRFEILATDIDTDVLSRAMNGVYPMIKRKEIPSEYDAYVQEGKREAEGWFRIAETARSSIRFQAHNLVEPELPAEAPFDLILCRNVMIYFSPQTVAELVFKLHLAGKPESHLFIGHSESLQHLQQPWELVRPAVFVKTEGLFKFRSRG